MQQAIGLKCGYRTPFVKKDTLFASLNAVDLSTRLVNGMLEKLDFPVEAIQHVIWGMVVPDPNIYSIAREVVLASRLDNRVEAYSVSRACATSLQAATNAATYYQSFPGEKTVALVGGVESFSNVRPVLTDAASGYFKSLAEKGTFLKKLGRALKIPFSKIFPVPPAAREYSTGLTMGEHCEQMIREFKIPRESQDVFALASHQNASKARPLIHDQIIPVKGVDKDNLIRDNASLEAMAKLAVAFDKKEGTITAGNASPYTDGAAGLYVISPGIEGAIKPDAHLIDFEYVGVDPDSGLLMGPGKAVLRVLERHKMKWADLDYIDIHEAFSGQVLSVVAGLNDSGYRAKNYGVNYDPGFLDEKRLNPWGSSIAYGHPFGATGARMLNQAMAYLKHENKKRALVTACTAGGLAGACLLERR